MENIRFPRFGLVSLFALLLCSPAVSEELFGFGFFTIGLDDGSRADWGIEITSRNSIIVTLTRSGDMDAIGPLSLQADEGAELWALIREARFDQREENVRVQESEEVLFTFITVGEDDRRSFILRRADVLRDRRLRRLVEGIENTIGKHAGEAPDILE